jgi:hypothetical protein
LVGERFGGRRHPRVVDVDDREAGGRLENGAYVAPPTMSTSSFSAIVMNVLPSAAA